MKKQTIGAAASIVIGLAALRRAGPSLHQQAMGKCQEMLHRMAQGVPSDRTTGDSDDWPGGPCDPAGCRPGETEGAGATASSL